MMVMLSLNLNYGVSSIEKKGHYYNEMLALVASFNDCQDLGPGDLVWAKLTAFCDSKCKVRCSKVGVQKQCLYFCGVCCEKCNCLFECILAAFCDSKCKVRCSKAGVQKRCLYFCGVCCAKCNCVPSGTYGNKDECPCYRDMLSSMKTPKCP